MAIKLCTDFFQVYKTILFKLYIPLMIVAFKRVIYTSELDIGNRLTMTN